MRQVLLRLLILLELRHSPIRYFPRQDYEASAFQRFSQKITDKLQLLERCNYESKHGLGNSLH